MLEAIRSIFRRHPSQADGDSDDLSVAVCALLLEVAHADDDVTADERAVLERTLEEWFDLDPPAARDLCARAESERREAVDVYQFTSVVTRHFDEEQRRALAESMWRVVYADGRLSRGEGQHVRKLTRLLDIGPEGLTDAKRRAVRSVLQLRMAPTGAGSGEDGSGTAPSPAGSASRQTGEARRVREARMDEALADTFPASDPPAWTTVRETAEDT